MEIQNETKEKKETKNQLKNGILSLIGASFMNLIYPSIFSLCTFVVYQTSYIKNNGGNVNINHTMFYYPVVLLFQSIFGLIAGFIYSKIEVHWTNLLGSILVILGSLLLYVSKYFALDMVSMAVDGIAIAIIMFPATTNACKYFMKHIGLVNGIIETVISLGSTFFAFIGEKIINPDNKESREDDFLYDNYIAKKVKTFLLIQMACVVGSYIIGFILIKKYNDDDKNNENNAINNAEQAKEIKTNEVINLDNNNNNIEQAKNITSNDGINTVNIITNVNKEIKNEDINKIRKEKLKKALKSWTFWRYNIISLCQSPITDMVFAMYRSIGESKRINQKTLQLIGTLNFVVELVFSFLYGILCDYVNFKILLFSMNIIGTIVGFTYCLTFNNSFFFALLTLLITVEGAAYYSIKDYHLMKVFGTDIYIDISGFVCLFTGIIVIILTFITYYVEEMLDDKDKAYWIMFCIFGGINGIGVVLGFFESDDPFVYEENKN